MGQLLDDGPLTRSRTQRESDQGARVEILETVLNQHEVTEALEDAIVEQLQVRRQRVAL